MLGDELYGHILTEVGDVFQETLSCFKLDINLIDRIEILYSQDRDIFFECLKRSIFTLIRTSPKFSQSQIKNCEKIVRQIIKLIFDRIDQDYTNSRAINLEDPKFEDLIGFVALLIRAEGQHRNVILLASNIFAGVIEDIDPKFKIFLLLLKKIESRINILMAITFLLGSKKLNLRKLGCLVYEKLCLVAYKNMIRQTNNLEEEEMDCFEVCQLAYLQILSADPNPSLRRSVLEHIDFSRFSIKFALERICDEDSSVRKQLFKSLAKEQVRFQSFTKTQFVTMIIFGVGITETPIKYEFYAYFLSMLWGEDQTALLSISGLSVVNELVELLNNIDQAIIEYYPEIHRDIRTFIRELMLRTDPLLIQRMVEHLGMTVLTNVEKARVQELILIDIVLESVFIEEVANITPFREEKLLVEEIYRTFPMMKDLCNKMEDFYIENRDNYLNLYYFFKIISYLVNYDEFCSNTLNKNLRVILENMNYTEHSFGDIYNRLKQETQDLYELNLNLGGTVYNSEHSLRLAYFTQDQISAPILLSATDTIGIIMVIYRKTIADQHNSFTREILMMISESIGENYHKVFEFKEQQEIKMQAIIERITKTNKRKETEEYEKLKNELEKSKLAGIRHVNKLLMGVKKSAEMFLKFIILVNFGPLDDNLKMVGDYFRKMRQFAELDRDLNIMVFKMECYYNRIQIDNLKQYYESTAEDILKFDLCLYMEEDTEYQDLVMKKICILQSLFDTFIFYNMFENEPSQEAIKNSATVLLSTIITQLFAKNEEINLVIIKGLGRMIMTMELENSEMILIVLMLLWRDKSLHDSNQMRTIKLLSFFFINFSSTSFDTICRLERGISALTVMLREIWRSKDAVNQKYLDIDILAKDNLCDFYFSVSHLLNYEKNKTLLTWKKELGKNVLSPIERIFSLMCYLVGQSKKAAEFEFLISLFDKSFLNMDFMEHARYEILAALFKFSNEAYEKLPEKFRDSNFGIFCCNLKEIVARKLDAAKIVIQEGPNAQIGFRLEEMEDNIQEYTQELTDYIERLIIEEKQITKDLEDMNIVIKQYKNNTRRSKPTKRDTRDSELEKFGFGKTEQDLSDDLGNTFRRSQRPSLEKSSDSEHSKRIKKVANNSTTG